MNDVLLISNRRLDENVGRSEKFRTRVRLLEERGWNVTVGYVEKTTILGIVPNAIRLARLAHREDIDIINSVSSPFHLQLIGYLVSLLTSCPWLAEFRDPLITNPNVDPNSLPWYFRRAVERLIITKSDKVVWFDGIQLPEDYFTTRYSTNVSKKCEKLPFMGFEREQLEPIDANKKDEFTITYAGSFYSGWIEPYSFLQGVAIYAERYDTNDFKIQFFGDWADEYSEFAAYLGIDHLIDPHGYISHEKVIAELKGSDIVVHIGGSKPRNRLNIPSKLWDYIGVQKPILAVVDPSFRVAKLIHDNEIGIIAPPNSPDSTAKALEKLHSDEFQYNTDIASESRFSREQTVNEFARVLDELHENKNLVD
ncbi:glycosyltransferase [Haladaptatus sp. CMAA 1911]|uniref:glycosyltransferase n=1 Tax=unclassified Haladaptatus TaxID=2622732 RepID=UPI0037553B50